MTVCKISASSIFLQNFFKIFRNNPTIILRASFKFYSSWHWLCYWTIKKSWKQHFAFINVLVVTLLTYHSSNINASLYTTRGSVDGSSFLLPGPGFLLAGSSSTLELLVWPPDMHKQDMPVAPLQDLYLYQPVPGHLRTQVFYSNCPNP